MIHETLEEGVGVEPTYIRSAGGRVTVPPSLHYMNPIFYCGNKSLDKVHLTDSML